jgi:diadenylate cyclase
LIVAVLFYYGFNLLRKTNGSKSFRGVIVVLVFVAVVSLLELRVVNFLIQNVLQIGIIALVVLFQPELRRLLEKFGRAELGFFHEKKVENPEVEEAIRQTVAACSTMSWNKTGALIVFENEDDVSSFADNGTAIDAKVTDQLLMNLFFNKSPLHDGAVIISNGRIRAAGCVLPLSDNFTLSKELGTRHRAAVGMSEHYDCSCVVVSEETGSISLAKDGILKRHLSTEMLERMLRAELLHDQPEEDKNWRGKARQLAGKTREKVSGIAGSLKKERRD